MKSRNWPTAIFGVLIPCAVAGVPAHRCAAQIELPSVRVVRVQTTVWVPANRQPIVLGEVTTVHRAPRCGWVGVPAGPRSVCHVYVTEQEAPVGPATLGGIDVFLLPEVEREREAARRAREAAIVPAPLERARAAMLAGRSAEAEGAYREHLQAVPRDAIAKRERALALLADGEHDDAAVLIAEVYDADPSLAQTPLDVRLLARGKPAAHELLQRVTARANRRKTAGAWVWVLVLRQACGATSGAARVAERAIEAGVPERLVRALQEPPAGEPAGNTPEPGEGT